MTPDPFISSKLSRTHPQAPTCTAPGSPPGTVALGPEGVENAGSWASHLVAGPAQTFLYQLAWRPESGLSSCQLRARPSPGADRGPARRGHSGPPGPTWVWEQGPAAGRLGHTLPWCPRCPCTEATCSSLQPASPPAGSLALGLKPSPQQLLARRVGRVFALMGGHVTPLPRRSRGLWCREEILPTKIVNSLAAAAPQNHVAPTNWQS